MAGRVLGVVDRVPSVVVGSNKAIGLVFWLAVIAGLGTLEALSHLSAWPIPGAADLVARYLRHRVARVGAIGLWLFAGYHLFCH